MKPVKESWGKWLVIILAWGMLACSSRSSTPPEGIKPQRSPGLLSRLMNKDEGPETIPASALQYFKQGNDAFEKRDYASAISFYNRAIELDAQTAEFHYNLGVAYYESGRYDPALRAFDRASKLNPEAPEIYYNMALAYNKLYKSDLANKYYNKYQTMLEQRTPPAPAVPPATVNVPASPSAKSQEQPSLEVQKAAAAAAQKALQEKIKGSGASPAASNAGLRPAPRTPATRPALPKKEAQP